MALMPWGHVSTTTAQTIADGSAASIAWHNFQTNRPDIIGTIASTSGFGAFNNTSGDRQLACIGHGIILVQAIVEWVGVGDSTSPSFAHSISINRNNMIASVSAGTYGHSSGNWDTRLSNTDGVLDTWDSTQGIYDQFTSTDGTGVYIFAFNGDNTTDRDVVRASMFMTVLLTDSVGDPRVYGTSFG